MSTWAALALSCGSSDRQGSGNSELIACDPLAAMERPIGLGTIVAAGRDANGAFYVAEQPSDRTAQDRVFVSNADMLFRRRVLGTGFGGGLETVDYSWSFEDEGGPRRLVAQLRDNAVTGVALVRDANKTFLDELGPEAEPLTPASEAEVRALHVRNLPGEIVLEYVASIEDGSQLIVTRPRDDWTYEDFRLFSGDHGQLEEREVLNVARGRDGGTTWITVAIAGTEHEAVFPSPLSTTVAPTFGTEARALHMTLQDPAAGVPTGTSFRCLP